MKNIYTKVNRDHLIGGGVVAAVVAVGVGGVYLYEEIQDYRWRKKRGIK